jgi:hypothetical protein
VDLEPRLEADSGIVAFSHLAKRLKHHRIQQLGKAFMLRTGPMWLWSLARQREFTKEMCKINGRSPISRKLLPLLDRNDKRFSSVEWAVCTPT